MVFVSLHLYSKAAGSPYVWLCHCMHKINKAMCGLMTDLF